MRYYSSSSKKTDNINRRDVIIGLPYFLNNFLFLRYIATELFEDTLESFVKKSYQKSSKSNILKYTNSMLNVCHQAAQGLEYIHENGLIHGEIKPRNILVRKRKEGTGIACKIADLGLSNTSYTNGHNNLSSKLDFEKLSWMAPELLQHGSWNNRSQKCDVWSFGCIVHYALTGGEHPFGDGLHQRAINIAQGICQLGSLRRCKDLQHAITADVVTLVEKMICLNPNSRPTISQVVPLLKPNSLKNSSRKTAMPQNKYPDALFKTEISYSSVKLQAVKVKDAIIFLLSSLMVLILENLNLKRVVETTVKTDENEDGITEQVNGQSDNQHHKADDTRRWTKEDLKRGR